MVLKVQTPVARPNGGQDGQDAFNPRDTTIVFDVQRLEELYGSALESDNVDRIEEIPSRGARGRFAGGPTLTVSADR